MSPLLLAAWMGCQTLDAGTTAIALRNPNISEGNSMMRGPHLYAIKISVNVAAILWNRHLVKEHPTAARALPLVLAGTGCTAGVFNINTMRKARP